MSFKYFLDMAPEDDFMQLAKERYKVEAKNSKLKNGHGYDTATSADLFGMQIQEATEI